MLPDRFVESCHKTHVSVSPCWLSSLYAVRSDCPHPYWLWPGVQGGSPHHHVCSSPSQLWAPTLSKGSAVSQWMPEAQIVIVATPAPALVLGAFGPSYVTSSFTAFPDACQEVNCDFFFFFLIHWHQKLFLLSWIHYGCRGFSQTQIHGAGPWNRTCKTGHLVCTCAKEQLQNGLQTRPSLCVSSSSPASTICSVCVETPTGSRKFCLMEETQDKSWGQTGRRPCCTDRCSSGFTWFLQEESNLSKLVWVCFFVLFYSLVHILSPSVLNHLSAGLIQFTEFLSGIWCRSLYHPIPPRPGWCI